MTRLGSPVCHLDQPTRHQTHLTQPPHVSNAQIDLVFDFEVLSAKETGFQPHLNGTQQTVPTSTPNLPAFLANE